MSKFEPLFPEINQTKQDKTTKKTKAELKKEEDLRREILGKENLSKLDTMVAPLLVFKASQNKNEWLVLSAKAVLEEPYRLTEKWINSLNKWAKETYEAISLDQPNLKEKERYFFENKTILKIIPANPEQSYPVDALMLIDDSGWKFYFKTTKAKEFSVGDVLSFKATVKGHDDGITFLSRAASIKASFKQDNIGDQGDK